MALTFGLSAVVLLGLTGGGIDYARLASRRSQLQNAADAGVLAAGNYLKLAVATSAAAKSIVVDTIQAQAAPRTESPYALQVDVADDRTSVAVTVDETVKLAFGGFVGVPMVKVAVRSKARVVGKMRLCLLTLDPLADGAFELEKSAEVTAQDCSLYSNSLSPRGMVGKDNAYARAQTICTAGGFDGARANFAPPPQTSCPPIQDPLKDRAPPPIGACTAIPASANSKRDTSGNLVDQSVTLDPGTYCGGLHITKSASVALRAGTYVMKDGPLIVDKDAAMTGIDVAFYFTGNKGGLVFDKKTTVSLSAPTTGPMAGLLMMEERVVSDPVDPTQAVLGDVLSPIAPTPPPLAATKPMRTYRIISDNARTMLGTLYLPAGRVVIDASKPVADQSAYTVIVAQQVNLYEGPNLYLNANYDATSVPVPKGVGPLSGKLLLSQ
ncbi:membrane Transport [Methylobacterium phyllosphaerae]|uniref:Flp pilus-assembly TadE/G-like n=2 Tax=Methylobacterium TaxID=407 RepID=A0AAE8HNE8_9HYPH|nr:MULTISPECIES: Tad domain-containing protein [Methylobacterium]AIQ90231.1 protein of unassigned function [Methylobacterium oryzae CBMB20]APT30973.1 membrane Transport [Methylobacterium phyllosphaerae]WFS09994.1 Tad domain-containing protein [Methylobacterium sp. 391_Methyba4]SFG33274.1 Putative Flp pilus-assembly TadE/G-like [Methylobacterium phyllosphaerae]